MSIWKDIVKGIAPVLGTALGGPFGGAATKFIAGKIFGDENTSIKDIEQFIVGASAEDLANLKNIDNDFDLQMKALDIDIYELEFKDRDSARNLYKVNIWPQIVLSALFIIGYFSILGFLLVNPDSLGGNNQGVLITILGVLTAAIPQILSFWFGSSLGSKEKTQKLKGK